MLNHHIIYLQLIQLKNIKKIIELRKNEYKDQEDKLRTFQSPSDLLYEKYDEDDDETDEFIEKKNLINEYFSPNKEDDILKYESVRDLSEEYFQFPKDNLIKSLLM